MRQLTIQVPAGAAREVLALTGRLGGMQGASVEASDGDARFEVVSVYVPNARIGEAIDQLRGVPHCAVTLNPHDALPLGAAGEPVPEATQRVGSLSPLEVYVAGLQSLGSWKGLVGYALAAGALAWIAMFTNRAYLLVAAMLISPLASPAMNLAIGTARGDGEMIRRALTRYVAALGCGIASAAALSWLLRQQTATLQMIDTSQISSVSVLLPLVAGAAGAFSQAQSRRDSLVSAAATGMLVAATLAPAASLIGMAAVLGDWEMAKNGAFLLALQLAGINVAGAAVFWLHGLRPRGVGQRPASAALGVASLALSALALAGLLLWQFSAPPEMQRATRAQRAAAAIEGVVRASPLADLVEADVRFTGADIAGQHTLLCVLYVQRRPGADPAETRRALTAEIRARLKAEHFQVVPLVDLTVLDAPGP